MRLYLFFASALFFSCTAGVEEKNDKLFIRQSSAKTGVTFSNTLAYTEELNPYTYRNFYNGAGVAAGDINNDGLDDLYFAGNQVDNKLYLNKGDFVFEDITPTAGVACPNVWCTGVTMADVNADGWLDIYVCKSGAPGSGIRHNELFINNKDLTFTERSKEYGLDLTGLSTHAAFFDYDRDGDLDAYVISNSLKSIGGFDLIKDQRTIPDDSGQGTKLFRNTGGKYEDVTAESGIYSSRIGFGLGVTIGDINNDSWLDIFVSNDFFERDYLYINQKNGSFKEAGEGYFSSLSLGSMGADLADVNNDMQPDLVVTEMLPDRADRYKTKANFESWDKQQITASNGYYYQYPRNMLHINSGDNYFYDIGRFAGIEATDWSWGALLNDFDGDGWKDIFIANGIRKDLVDQDYVNFMADPQTVRSILSRKGSVLKEIVDKIPAEPLPNYIFRNENGFHYANASVTWGLDEASFSNGAAYSDLDNDGDPDLIVSNVDGEAFIYKNTASEKGHHFLRIQLQGDGQNTFCLGSKVEVYAGGNSQYQELIPTRGFMSSVSYKLQFGVNDLTRIDSVIVRWPNERISRVTNISADSVLTLSQRSSSGSSQIKESVKPVFTINTFPGFRDSENDFSDFDRDRLLYHMVSNEGPKMCKGDVNDDGFEDFYVGGSRDETGVLFQQTRNGTFVKTNLALFEQDKTSEECECEFFDADGDGDQDLYVTTGSNELPTSSTALLDFLYVNDGKGKFEKSNQLLPTSQFESTSVVRASDFDADGDQDLFVGVRMQPFVYGIPCNGYILVNDGRGNYSDATSTVAPGLKGLGMITDAVWADIDNDSDQDLVIVGDWMPIMVFENNNGRLAEISGKLGLDNTHGWWNRVVVADLDNDGDTDFVVGNHGLNSRFRASVEKPVRMLVNDFDQNGTVEQIICRWWGDKEFPLALRHDLVAQMPSLKKKYLKYESYKDQGISDIFTPAQLKNALSLKATLLSSVVLYNDGKTFRVVPLPDEAQLSPVYAVVVMDFNRDGYNDLLLGGNQYRVKPEAGRYDASHGLYLRGTPNGMFAPLTSNESGVNIRGEVRDFLPLSVKGKQKILVAVNSDSLKILTY